MISQPTLMTSRLLLRPFSIEDAETVAELANDEELSRNLRSFDFPYSLQDATQWIERLAGDWEHGRSAVFAVCLRPLPPDRKEQLVGAIGTVIDQQSNRAELGYWVGRKHWGRGIASEAAASVLDFGFNQIGLNKVVAECLVRNPASARVLEKVGMVQEGYLKQHFRKNESDEFSDVRVFGLLRTAWNERILPSPSPDAGG